MGLEARGSGLDTMVAHMNYVIFEDAVMPVKKNVGRKIL